MTLLPSSPGVEIARARFRPFERSGLAAGAGGASAAVELKRYQARAPDAFARWRGALDEAARASRQAAAALAGLKE